MREKAGRPLPLGVTICGNTVNFSVAVSGGQECQLLLYPAGKTEPCEIYEMHPAVGEVYTLALENVAFMEYNYRIGGEIFVDPYAKALAGREHWGADRDVGKSEVRGILYDSKYDWEEDRPLELPDHKVVAYSLHVRGFTKHPSSGVKGKGTFRGVVEKIPYLLDLGINQIQCMPVYDFEECKEYCNYWGYGEGYFFAPKGAFASTKDAVKELKDMIKSCHKAGIEVVVEMPFAETTPKQMMEECLRYYRMEYHVDGFILNPYSAPMDGIYADPVLKRTKLLTHQMGFQTSMRRFLKGDEGMVGEVMYLLRHTSQEDGSYNTITGQNGFTLCDLVSYDGKHNEKNGEHNQDGPDYNYSWNCGAEGPSRKKTVVELRNRQMRNAFMLLLLAQGTPCILAGDEFANSQEGNNNVYCQDNPIGWVDWSKQKRRKELREFVKEMIGLRKHYGVFCPAKEMLGIDQVRCGIPDVSYHGESAWRVPSEVSSRQLGVYYSGAAVGGEDCFVAYNMHWLEHEFALPSLPRGKKWYLLASTDEGILKEAELLERQKSVPVDARTIMVMVGR